MASWKTYIKIHQTYQFMVRFVIVTHIRKGKLQPEYISQYTYYRFP